MANEEKLTDLLDCLTDFFKEKLINGELTAAEQKNVVQLLRDNGITIDTKEADPLKQIAEGNFDDIDWEEFTKS